LKVKRWLAAVTFSVVYAALMLLVVYAADVSGAFLTAKVTVTETTGSAQTNVVAAVPLSTQGLIDAGIVNGSTANIVLCEDGTTCPVANELPMMPSPVRTRVEGAHQDDGGGFTSETTDANDAGTNDIAFFANPAAVNDAFYVLADHQFTIVAFNTGTAGAISTTTLALAWEYYNGSAYTAVSGLADGTGSFANTGIHVVTWDIPPDMAEDTINGTTGYSVRARVTEGATFTTAPLGTQIWYETGVMWVFNDSLAANQAQGYALFVGGVTEMATSHQMFLGDDGITTSDTAELEPGLNDYNIEIAAFFDMSAKPHNVNFFDKGVVSGFPSGSTMAFGSTAGEIIIDVRHTTDPCQITATGISTGFHVLRLEVDTPNACTLFIDGASEGSDGVGNGGLDPQANDWHWVLNPSGYMPYVQYVRYDHVGGGDIHYELNASTTAEALTDLNDIQGGAAQNGTPDFHLFPTSTTGAIASFVTTDAPATQAAQVTTGSAVGIVAPTAAFASTSAAVAGLPGGVFISRVATDANLPAEFYWLIIASFLSLAAFVGVQLTMKNLWWSVVAGGVVLTAFTAPTVGIWSVWAIMFYGIMSGLVLIVGDRFQATAG
jgi:hypothetical protein